MITPAATRDYLKALEVRRTEAKVNGQINNSSLPAGSPMYFYCRICSLLADIKPECYTTAPKKYCEACQEMVDKGYSPTLSKFPGIDEEVV